MVSSVVRAAARVIRAEIQWYRDARGVWRQLQGARRSLETRPASITIHEGRRSRVRRSA